jgi:hypothetical protein
MIVILGFLCGVALIKLLAIFNTAKWIGRNGVQYRRAASRKWPLTVDTGESLLDDCSGGFFPFGVKEYRLRLYVRRMRHDTALRRTLRQFLHMMQNAFEFQYLAFLISAYLIVGAHASGSVILAPRSAYGLMGLTLGALLMISVTLLAALAFTSYAVLGSYGVIFYSDELARVQPSSSAVARSGRNSNSNAVITEMYAYAGMLTIAYVAISSTSYFVSMQLGGFDLLNDKIGPGLIDGNRLFNSFYWTMMMAVGSGGAGPASIIAKVITMVGTITALLLLVIVLAGLAGITITTPEQPHRVRRQGQKAPSPQRINPSVRPIKYTDRTSMAFSSYRRKAQGARTGTRRAPYLQATRARNAPSPDQAAAKNRGRRRSFYK